MGEKNKSLFVDSFAQFMLRINSQADVKFKNLKSTALTWIVEFMGKIKSMYSNNQKDPNPNVFVVFERHF